MDGEEGEGDKHSGWLVVGTQEGLRGQVVGQADVRPGPLYQARRREGARMMPRDVVQACCRCVFAGRDSDNIDVADFFGSDDGQQIRKSSITRPDIYGRLARRPRRSGADVVLSTASAAFFDRPC